MAMSIEEIRAAAREGSSAPLTSRGPAKLYRRFRTPGKRQREGAQEVHRLDEVFEGPVHERLEFGFGLVRAPGGGA